jgi:hypothetical protein
MSCEEPIDHVFDWEKTVKLRAKPVANVGEGFQSWAPFVRGLNKCQIALQIDTDGQRRYPKSLLPPRIRDKRLCLLKNTSTNKSHNTSNSLESSWSPSEPTSQSQTEYLPFIPKQTVTLRKQSVESCSHSPRFRNTNSLAFQGDQSFESSPFSSVPTPVFERRMFIDTNSLVNV